MSADDNDFKDFLDRHQGELTSNLNLTDDLLLSLKSTDRILPEYEYEALKEKNIVQRAINFHGYLCRTPGDSRLKISSIISVFRSYQRQCVVAVLKKWSPPGEGQVPEAVKSATFSGNFHNFDLTTIPLLLADRKNELALIKKVLDEKRAPSGARVAILAGMGGAGKTTLARLYAKVNQNDFENLYWIDAEQEKEVIIAFQEIQSPGIELESTGVSIFITERDIECVYKLLQKTENLLIFDNVDVELLSMIHKYLPKAVSTESPPTIIITTRIWEDWKNLNDHVVPVRELSMDVCENYIREGLAKSPIEIPDVENYWRRLAKQFGGLVIALQAAVKSIVEQNKLHKKVGKQVYTIGKFLKDVSKVDILEELADLRDPIEKVNRPLRQLWTKTLNELPARENGGTCEKILYVLAFFGTQGVRKDWFFHMFKKDCEAQVMFGIDDLTAWSLADVTDHNLVMHRVLQSIVVSRIRSDQEKSNMFFKWLEGATRRLVKHLRVHDRPKFSKLKLLKQCLRSLCEQLKCENVSEAAVRFCTNMFTAHSVPVLNYWKVRAIWKNCSVFEDVFEFIGCFLDKLCENIEAGVARVSPEILGLLAKTSRFEGHRLIPTWLKECSSLPWNEKVCFANSVLASGSYKYTMKLAGRLQLSVSISEVLAEVGSRADLVQINTLSGIQALVEFLWQEHFWFLEKLETQIQLSDDLLAKTEIQTSMIQVFKNINNIVTKLTKGIFESSCQDVSKLLNYLDILIKWRLFFTENIVEQLPIVEDGVQNLKQGCFLSIKFPAGHYKTLQQALSQIYGEILRVKPWYQATVSTVSEEQIEFETRILVIFSANLGSLHRRDVNSSNIFSKLMSFVHNTNEIYKRLFNSSALPLMMFFSSFEVIFHEFSDGSSLDTLVSCDSDAFLAFKIETLMQLLQELRSSCFETDKYALEEEIWQPVLCVLEPVLPNIRKVFRCIIDTCKNSSAGVWWKTIYRLELAISKFGYQRYEVFKILSSIDLHKNMNTFLLIVEQITCAAEQESNLKKHTFDEEDYLCSCYHSPYQLLLVGCYESAGKMTQSIQKASQVCLHCIDFGVKVNDYPMSCIAELESKTTIGRTAPAAVQMYIKQLASRSTGGIAAAAAQINGEKLVGKTFGGIGAPLSLSQRLVYEGAPIGSTWWTGCSSVLAALNDEFP